MKAIDHTNEVSAARMFAVLRARAEAELLSTFSTMDVREVIWRTDEPIQEYEVSHGILAFIPCTLVFGERENRGYTLLVCSEFLPDRWRPIPCFYMEDLMGPELVSKLAVNDFAPLFQNREALNEEPVAENESKLSQILRGIVACSPLVALVGFAISYSYTGEVLFNIERHRFFRDTSPDIYRHPLEVTCFFVGLSMLTASGLIWGFNNQTRPRCQRAVWWLGYGGAGVIIGMPIVPFLQRLI